ncbi:DUF302 domain-containing protein [Aciditerrimonas ferrireducens]|uniref:DUF302 domain-containing protein n=1 Tax=Aciditerrimonas ferrireducens TaxID=667306 RepID=A0ABV6C2R3_9ACTN
MHGIRTTLDRPLPEAEAQVREALASAGFGVLTEIDVAGTLRAKLGVERPPLKILGACNPGYAHRALETDPQVALLLPCNVVLEEATPGRTTVTVADPEELLPGPELAALAAEAKGALDQAVSTLQASSGTPAPAASTAS